MNTILRYGLLLLVVGAGRRGIAQAFTNSFELQRYTMEFGTSVVSVSAGIETGVYVGEQATEYTCYQELRHPDGLVLLVPALPGTFDPRTSFPPRLTFLPLEAVNQRWALWPNQRPSVGVVSYSWSTPGPDWPPGFFGSFDWSGGRTVFLFGLRLNHDDGEHYGWLRMTRSAAGITNLFEFDSHAIHPVPNEPIQAGVEAPPPALTAEPGDPGEGTAFVLRWAAGYSDNAGYRLESAENLTPPVEWHTVESYAGEFPVPVGMENRFYRLRSP